MRKMASAAVAAGNAAVAPAQGSAMMINRIFSMKKEGIIVKRWD
jgi:hypothetical protein